MILTLLTLALTLHLSSTQIDECADVAWEPGLTEEICNTATPLNGDCCECDPEATNCPICTSTLCPGLPITCDSSMIGFLTGDPNEYFELTVPNTVNTLILSLCNDITLFNTTLTIFDDTMTQIAYDDNGCNDDIGKSRIKLDGVTEGDYTVLLSSPVDGLESKYQLDVICESNTTCPECVYNVTLSGIANITIEECPEESPSPTSFHKNPWGHKGRKLSSVTNERRRLWGGLHPKNPWKDDGVTSSKQWFTDRVCIETDDRRRRRLWGWKPKHGKDGCNDDKPTPAPTPSNGFEEWYKDKCDIKDDKGWSHSYSGSKYGNNHHKHHGHRYTSWNKRHDKSDDFLTEVCVIYSIIDLVEDGVDCGDIDSVFLGICENNSTDFNSSTLSLDDLSGLIVSVNNNSDENIQSVDGAEVDDTLGILVTFVDDHSLTEFELCLGNVTVDADFNEERDSIDIGEGLIGINGSYLCYADGLPCLNFFFDIPCPPESTEDASCECVGGMTSLTLLYEPINSLNASIIGYYNARKSDAVLCEFDNVSPGTEIECRSDTYSILSPSTYFVITYYGTERRRMGHRNKVYIDPGDCSGKFHTSCSEQIIGTTSYGCDDLEAIAFVAVDGALCNEEILNDEDIAAENMINDNVGVFKSSPLKVFEEMDPYVRYSLYGIVFTFCGLTLVACYICVARRSSAEDVKDDIQREIQQQKVVKGDDEYIDSDHLMEMTSTGRYED